MKRLLPTTIKHHADGDYWAIIGADGFMIADFMDKETATFLNTIANAHYGLVELAAMLLFNNRSGPKTVYDNWYQESDKIKQIWRDKAIAQAKP